MCQFIHKKNDCSENIMKRFVSVAYGKVMAFQGGNCWAYLQV